MDYNDYEEKGRKKLENLFNNSNKIAKYEFSKFKFERYDCLSTGLTGELSVYEIKDRDIDSTKYETLMMERSKYDALIDVYKKSGYTPYYVNFYRDCIYIFPILSIDDIENRTIELPCTRSTVNYGKKIIKRVIMLEKNEGILIHNCNNSVIS